jgi:hypothetical protein
MKIASKGKGGSPYEPYQPAKPTGPYVPAPPRPKPAMAKKTTKKRGKTA